MALNAYRDLVNSRDQVVVRFRFQINSTSDPDNVVPANSLVSDVVRTGAGVFTVTFSELFPTFIGGVGSVMEATPAHDLIVKLVPSDYDASAGTMVVRVVGADGTPAAEDPVDNDWVYCELVFARFNNAAVTGAI